MQIPILRKGSAGGVNLNFKVVGGALQPTDPNENTIWVNTDQKITGWVFSIDEPSSSMDGIIWIGMSDTDSGYVELNISFEEHKSSSLYLKPVRQKEGDAWVYKQAKIFIGGEWKDLSRLLYDTGTEYITWTGANGGGTGTGTTTKQATALYTKAVYSSGSNGKYASFYTPSTVDISEYKTLKAEVNMTNRAQEAGLYIADTAAKAKQVSYSKSLSYHRLYYGTDKAGEYTLSINLANVTTKQVYIGIGVVSGVGDGTGVMTVSRIWLE